jgi:predicted component of type VI protein secretion system
MAQFRFVMRSGPTVGKEFPLEAQEISIGRDSTNTVAISDAEVSRRHARMEFRGSAYAIQDLGSTNGTFVNGARVSGMQQLNPGDVVSFGEGIVLAYEAVSDYNATVLSSKPDQMTVQQPLPASIPEPAPAPAFRPAPAPVYSGQVPAGPVPKPAPVPAKAKKKFPVWLIILIILLLIICVCVGAIVLIDQLNLWCKLVPFLVPLLGGTC